LILAESTSATLWTLLANALGDPEHHQGFWTMAGGAAGWATVVVVAVAAVIALSQLLAQVRPFVVIEFRPDPSSLIYLRITNLGTTMARNVRFVFDRPLSTTRGLQWDPMQLQVFQSGVKTLAPGSVVEFLFDTWIGRDEKDDAYEVTVTYRGGWIRRFRDVIDLNLGAYRNMRFVRRAGLHEIHKQLEGIAGSLKDFEASGGGLLFVSPRDLAKREAEMGRRFEKWQAEQTGKHPTEEHDPAIGTEEPSQ